MESTAQNNSAMMATGASLADLPLEEEDGSKDRSKEHESESKGESREDESGEVSEVVDKILEDIKSSGRDSQLCFS